MDFFGIILNFRIEILKSKHLVCLSFWDISRDSGFRIYISMEKMWPLASTTAAPIEQSGVSLYIIIAIIVIVILLCVLFYVTKWCRKKNKKEEQEREKLSPKDAEEGQGLINQPKSTDPTTDDSTNPTTPVSSNTQETKGQIKSEWIYEIINFPKYEPKNLKDFGGLELLEGGNYSQKYGILISSEHTPAN